MKKKRFVFFSLAKVCFPSPFFRNDPDRANKFLCRFVFLPSTRPYNVYLLCTLWAGRTKNGEASKDTRGVDSCNTERGSGWRRDWGRYWGITEICIWFLDMFCGRKFTAKFLNRHDRLIYKKKKKELPISTEDTSRDAKKHTFLISIQEKRNKAGKNRTESQTPKVKRRNGRSYYGMCLYYPDGYRNRVRDFSAFHRHRKECLKFEMQSCPRYRSDKAQCSSLLSSPR